MEVIFLIIALIFAIGGIIGSVLPIIPGPPLSFFAVLALHFSGVYSFNVIFILVCGLIAAGLTILDYAMPSWITQRFGGSKNGAIGSMIGLIAGSVLLPIIGIVIGPFIGAFIGELTAEASIQKALKSAFFSFVGFLISTGLKLGFTITVAYYIIKALIGSPPTTVYPII